MYFHVGTKVTILFKGWSVDTTGGGFYKVHAPYAMIRSWDDNGWGIAGTQDLRAFIPGVHTGAVI